MKHLRTLTILIAMLWGYTMVHAEAVQIDGIWYNLVKKIKQAEVTGNPDSNTKYSGVITIPATVTHEGVDYSVTSIGENAFSGCSSLTSITIPENVTSIGQYAFYKCSRLTFINIPESVTSIGEYAFYYCTSLTISINIPESVTSIGEYAFSHCSSLTSINIPESVTSIGSGAFSDCTGELIVKCNIKSGGSSSSSGVFSESKFTKVTIGDKVTSIGTWAFYACKSITEVYISSIEAWCKIKFSFEGTPLQYGANLYLNGELVTDLTIPEGITSIESRAFYGCRSLTTITVPESVTSIGTRAFYNCSNLTAINIPEGVTSIGQSAFGGCSSLTSIVIPDGVTSIETNAFGSCSNLATIILPASLKEVASSAFANCPELLDVYCLANDVPSATTNAFDDSYPDYATLHVPTSAIASYQATAPWSSFGTIVAYQPVTNITLSQSSATIVEGDQLTLIATVLPENAADRTVTWSSSNESIASVDANGVVTAVALGTATITAAANDISGTSASCEVTVEKASLRNVTFVVDGKIYDADLAEDGTFPKAPEKEGYTFKEWQKEYSIQEIDIKSNADAMLYTNAPCTNTTYGDQFVGWHVLFDNDASTFFHSEYSNVDSSDGLDHYLRVDMGEGKTISQFTFTFTVRGDQAPYTPKTIVVEASNIADGEYEEIATLTDLPQGTAEVYESEILGNGNAYRYIRYRVTETVLNVNIMGHPCFYLAEFGMRICEPTDNDVYHAIYTPMIYKVYYYVGEELVNTIELPYGSTILAPELPESENCNVVWIGLPETVPAHDVVVNAEHSLSLSDDAVKHFSQSVEEECTHITYTRTFNNTNWQSLYVPFDIDYDNVKEDFDVAYINDVHQFDDDNDGSIDRTQVEAIKIVSGTLEANYPYLIRAKEVGEKTITMEVAVLYATEENSIDCSSVFRNYTFTGSYRTRTVEDLPASEGYYALVGGEWKQLSETAQLGAFRVYMKIDSRVAGEEVAAAISLRVVGDESEEGTTSIENSESDVENRAAIYDLQGRRAENPTKGVYIVNGEKRVF